MAAFGISGEESRRTNVYDQDAGPPPPRTEVRGCLACGAVSCVPLDVYLWRNHPIDAAGDDEWDNQASLDRTDKFGHSTTFICILCETRHGQRGDDTILYMLTAADWMPARYMFDGRMA